MFVALEVAKLVKLAGNEDVQDRLHCVCVSVSLCARAFASRPVCSAQDKSQEEQDMLQGIFDKVRSGNSVALHRTSERVSGFRGPLGRRV